MTVSDTPPEADVADRPDEVAPETPQKDQEPRVIGEISLAPQASTSGSAGKIQFKCSRLIYFYLVSFLLCIFLFILAFRTQRDESIFSTAQLLLDMFGDD